MTDLEELIRELVALYSVSLEEIRVILNEMYISDVTKLNAKEYEKAIQAVLDELTENTDSWAEKAIMFSVFSGIAQAAFSLDKYTTFEAAFEDVSGKELTKIHYDYMNAAIADTQADLLAVTNNVSRKTKTLVRQVVADTLRKQLVKGDTSVRQSQRLLDQALRAQLKEAANSVIVDAAGRKWQLKTYVDMVARTKNMIVARDTSINESLSRQVYYGRISKHGATDACRNWEGKIVKLVREAPGDFTYIGDIPNRELFHPNCRHTVSPISNISKYIN